MIYYKKKIQQDIGATAIEYGLIASLVAVVAVGGMSAVGMNLKNTYCTISKHLGGSGTCSGATSSSTSGTGDSTSGTGSGGSTSGTGVTSSCVPGGQCNTSNSYSLGNEENVKDFFQMVRLFGITNMSGFLDANGTPITTPSQLAGLFGKQAEIDFNNQTSALEYSKQVVLDNDVADVDTASKDVNSTKLAFQKDIDNYYSNNPSANPIFFNDPSSVSFSGSSPISNQTYQTTYSAKDNIYSTGLSGGLSDLMFFYNKPTVHGN